MVKEYKGKYKTIKTFRMTDSEVEALNKAAKAKGISVSKYIRIAVKNALLEG